MDIIHEEDSLCFYCRHIDKASLSVDDDMVLTGACAAFPDGIPDYLILGEHIAPHVGDGGVMFSPIYGYEHYTNGRDAGDAAYWKFVRGG